MNISSNVNYRNFGYIPTGVAKKDFLPWLFGHKNLVKRLQAKDLFGFLDLKDDEEVLDFGCGAGFYTVEMAKQAKKAVGVDINSYIERIKIPEILQGKLEFIRTNGESLPFADNSFDKVLASEVLPMLPDPMLFLAEIKRVLKPNGKLFVVNGAGHPDIKRFLQEKGTKYESLHKAHPDRFPASYAEYCKTLQNSFKTGQEKFFEETDIQQFMDEAKFEVQEFAYSPRKLAGDYCSWSQFNLYLETGKTLSQHNFYTKYWWLSFKSLFQRERFKGGLMCLATNIKD